MIDGDLHTPCSSPFLILTINHRFELCHYRVDRETLPRSTTHLFECAVESNRLLNTQSPFENAIETRAMST